MDQGTKRKSAGETQQRDEKRQRTKKQWRVPRKHENGPTRSRAIEPGDSGIWATCDKGREGKCVGELRDLFAEYAEMLYGDATIAGKANEEPADGDAPSIVGIENDIEAEIAEIRHPEIEPLFTPLRVDVQCVVFMKTRSPIEPVSFVKKICDDALHNASLKRTRFVKRLSPMTLMGKASVEGLETIARQVLAPLFHQQPIVSQKFAIRPTLRNHNILSRDTVIKQVAAIVGSGHEVNLKNYDLLIVVEVYKNICGISVVDSKFESLKRYNLSEIFDPTSHRQPDRTKEVQSIEVKDAEDAPEVDGTLHRTNG